MSQGTANAADSIRVAPHRSHCGQSYGSREVHPEADYSYIACARRKEVSHIELLNVSKRAKTTDGRFLVRCQKALSKKVPRAIKGK